MPLALGGFGSCHWVQWKMQRLSCSTQGGAGQGDTGWWRDPVEAARETSPAVLHAFCICLLECGSATSPAALMPPPQKALELFLWSAVLQSSNVSSQQSEVREKYWKWICREGSCWTHTCCRSMQPPECQCGGLKLPPGKGVRGNRRNPNMPSSCYFPLSVTKFSCITSKKNCSSKSQDLALKISAYPLYCKIKASSLLNTPLIRTVRNICNHVKLEWFGVSLHTWNSDHFHQRHC